MPLRSIITALFLPLVRCNHVVRSDQHWVDTDGNRIEAHAAGMLQSPTDKRWYWYGESKKTNTLADHGVTCYSAETIAGPWKFEGLVMAQKQIKEPAAKGPFVIERPKVLYNAKTRKFVMWFHLDGPFPEQPSNLTLTGGYNYRHAGIAQADKPMGPFEYVHGILPDGKGSLDMSLFQDPVDGKAYFIRSVENQYVGWSRLTDDYLNTTGIISTHGKFEGMAMFRLANGTYYIITSHLTGWNPNPLMLFLAEGKTLDDPQWFSLGNPTSSSTSFNSQPTYVVQYTPAKGAPYFVYMADDWVRCPNKDGSKGPLINACYIWLPIQFKEDTVVINWCAEWDLDDPFAPCPSPTPPGPAPTPATCEVSSQPAVGDYVALASCDAQGEAQTWKFDGDTLKLADLCLDTSGDAKLVTCTGQKDQQFDRSSSGGQLRRASDGFCLDVTWCGHQVCPEMKLEAYKCNSAHPNEEFVLNSQSGQLTSNASGKALCVSACKTQDVLLV